MTIDKFIQELEANLIGLEPGTLSPDTNFRHLPIWDSLAALTTLATFDACFGRQISGQQLGGCETVRDIFNLGTQ
ncbi:MAG: acyl carrier protein [Candidatus Didemnitutus sp.]|nr:acyl carrier protein [Candidatus Didemnitutus sp.]